MLLDLAAVQLVKLGGNDHWTVTVSHDPVKHGLVVPRRLVADIHKEEHAL